MEMESTLARECQNKAIDNVIMWIVYRTRYTLIALGAELR